MPDQLHRNTCPAPTEGFAGQARLCRALWLCSVCKCRFMPAGCRDAAALT